MSEKISPERIRLKRAYEPPSHGDGRRILVDRLWPRGVKKAEAAIDAWLKDLSPSPLLRKWFGHDPGRWDEFRRLYRNELNEKHRAIKLLRAKSGEGLLTLVHAAHNPDHSAALVLKAFLEGPGGPTEAA